MKYQYAILFDETYQDMNDQLKLIDGLSKQYECDNSNKSNCKYTYYIFAKNRKSKETFIEKYKELLDNGLVTPFSLFTRQVKEPAIMKLLADSKDDKVLHRQISAYPRIKKLVTGILENLDISRKDLSRLTCSTLQDIYNWEAMNALPDKLKTRLIEYLYSIDDINKDKFIKYLMSTYEEIGYKVEVLSCATKLVIPEFNKIFKNKSEAKHHIHGIRERLHGLNCIIRLSDFDGNELEIHNTTDWS
ncbi:hypothetical protein IBE10_07295 [Francisella tularensis subsp. novicida]|uniref:hypothetical protein n=1 Tax=Francisella tularensis TaxID=263 RepID=UPI0008FD20E0|nr:hypothetical protein [Francisella tularensis]APC96115.1 hypothetical protein KX02_988 [Francisella tularensis subsp. novicida]MBK2346724.1 hypothetical protein [Francisella tularensis subsp. novicida]